MLKDRLAGSLIIHALYAAGTRDDGVTESDGVDISGLAENLVVLLDSSAGGGADHTLDLTIEHRADSDDDWAGVPDAALYDPATGAAATFAQVTNAAASTQKLALKREHLKKEVRAVLAIAGSTPEFTCGVYLLGMPKYSSGW